MSSKKLSSTGLLTIDLEAIQSNWLTLKNKIQQTNPKAHCAAVVKADAYGLGVKPVALALMSVGCDVFFVATLNEGEELRDILGPTPIIVVLGGLSHGFARGDSGESWIHFDLTPVLFDKAHIDQWLNFCNSHNKAYACILKVDTGMHRFGLSENEFDQLLREIDSNKGQFSLFNPILLMSHLACADESDNAFNQEQLSIFRVVAKKMSHFFPDISLSLCNSSGIFLGDLFHFDMCRPGIALYGGNPARSHVDVESNPMRQVVSLSLPIMQHRTLHKGESAGYGQAVVANEKMHIAIVFGGYADGILRYLSNSGYAWCNGVAVPVVGRVSMDSIMFDVTALDDKPDSVQLFKGGECLDVFALSADTISYEILTSLGNRYQREYLGNSNEGGVMSASVSSNDYDK